MKILLAPQLPESFGRKCHLHPASHPTSAVAGELLRLGGKARIACIPDAAIILPVPVAERQFVA